MDTSAIYLTISIVVLAVIVVLVTVINRKHGARRLTPLAGIAFAFVFAGIAFGADRLFGYTLMGIGVALALFDIFKSFREKKS